MLVLGFIPIVLIEAGIYRLSAGPNFLRWLANVSIANVASTFLGVPATWVVLVILQMSIGGGGGMPLATTSDRLIASIVQSPWIVPYRYDIHWLMPAAGLVLTAPFLVASVFIEHWVISKLLCNKATKSAMPSRTIAWRANLVSYGFVGIFWVIALYSAVWT